MSTGPHPYFRTIGLPILILALAGHWGALAADTPPDREAAALAAALAADPEDAASWIRLGDLQRIMGYPMPARESFRVAAEVINDLDKEERRKLAGPYYTARAWLEYDLTDWEAARELAARAVNHDGGVEARLIAALAWSSQPHAPDATKPSFGFLMPHTDSGVANRLRNHYWIMLVRLQHLGMEWDPLEFAHTGFIEPNFMWGELACRRDHGFIFESEGYWDQARRFYELSVERSEVGRGDWALKRVGRTPLQQDSPGTMPFWTNRDGGYVTGSLMAYAEFACRTMLAAGPPDERNEWALRTAEGASRCLGVYRNEPWPWLWRALAWQATGDLKAASSDLAQAEAEFAAIGRNDPLLEFARGHESILEGDFRSAIPPLEEAVTADPRLVAGWSDLGLARVMTGDNSGARTAFDQALTLAPDCAIALHNRGVLNLHEGRIEPAVRDLEEASALAPGDEQIALDLQRARRAGQ